MTREHQPSTALHIKSNRVPMSPCQSNLTSTKKKKRKGNQQTQQPGSRPVRLTCAPPDTPTLTYFHQSTCCPLKLRWDFQGSSWSTPRVLREKPQNEACWQGHRLPGPHLAPASTGALCPTLSETLIVRKDDTKSWFPLGFFSLSVAGGKGNVCY